MCGLPDRPLPTGSAYLRASIFGPSLLTPNKEGVGARMSSWNIDAHTESCE